MRWRLLLLAVVALPLLAAGLLLTRAVLHGERERAEGEALRLALWRLDARATALVVGEASRTAEAYRSFWSPSEAFGEHLAPTGRVLLPSPLLNLPPAPLHLHLRLSGGNLASPQLPIGRERAVALAGLISPEDIAEAERRLATLGAALGSDPARALADLPIPPNTADSIALPDEPVVASSLRQRVPTTKPTDVQQKRSSYPDEVDAGDYLSRASNAVTAQEFARSQNDTSSQRLGKSPSKGAPRSKDGTSPQPSAPSNPVTGLAPIQVQPPAVVTAAQPAGPLTIQSSSVGTIEARWAGTDWLLLARRARLDGHDEVQLAALRWDELRTQLTASLADLLPQARLVPQAPGDPPERCLASLPIRLEPGVMPGAVLSDAARWTLGGAWGALLAGLAGAGALLLAAQRLADRRATFVSAVTHELRTPLTALRLHADLLADVRVADDPVRRDKRVQVLRTEAGRLAHLIDNVLDYARLERRQPPQPRPLPLVEVLAPMLPRLTARLAAAGLDLRVAQVPPWSVRCDPAAVERILLNLADNAAKYATTGPRTVELHALLARTSVELRLRDHGPGLADDVLPRLFKPFARSAEAAAGSAPGVGLGLALCRRLARAQGGDLRLETPEDGVEAVLVLPLG